MTNTIEAPDQEPLAPAKGPEVEQSKGRGRRKALSSARRELSEKELSSSAVQKLLLDEIDRLEDENVELSGYRGRFYEVDKKAAVLEQKGKISIAYEVISLACITIGAAALGYAPAVWANQPTGYISIAFGLVLVVCGIVAKAVKS